MIKKSTVFILGAGTSIPYGFPSGSLLVEQICAATAGTTYEDDPTALVDKGQIHDRLITKFGETQTEKFGVALYRSQKLSIDAFLEHRPEFINIGKFAIALFILRKEISNNLLDFNYRDKGCYQYLFNKMNTSWEEFAQNQVSFITFNYDRSLEHFLFTSLQDAYGRSDEECADKVDKIPIIHVHGKLGELPWQSKDGIQYGASLELKRDSPGHISAMGISASEQIKVITEDQNNSEELQSTFELLNRAERVFFLGFSYQETNMERLRILDLSEIKRIHNLYDDTSVVIKHSPVAGTAIGLEDAEIEDIQNKWYVRLPNNQCDSLRFLRKYANLD